MKFEFYFLWCGNTGGVTSHEGALGIVEPGGGVEDRCHGFSTNASWEKNIRGSIERVR